MKICSRTNSVCYGCMRRTSTCHTTCHHYIAEAERAESDREYRLQAKMAELAYTSTRQPNGLHEGGRG